MSDDINYKNSPLHGLSLKKLLIEVVDHYGFEVLYAYLNINCFKTNPSIESSVKFLKKTQWAREKIESFYLYQYKSLPRASDEQFALSPRDRIIPDDQTPGEPMELSVEDAERLREKRVKSAGERKSYRGHRDAASSSSKGRPKRSEKDGNERSDSSSQSHDPWSKWR